MQGATNLWMPERIEAGSYACAAAITGGSLELGGANAADMHAILAGLREAGVTVEERPDCIKVSAHGPLRPLSLSTAPLPAFPTELNAQFHSMLPLDAGPSVKAEERRVGERC